jgi:hypothetical protein
MKMRRSFRKNKTKLMSMAYRHESESQPVVSGQIMANFWKLYRRQQTWHL